MAEQDASNVPTGGVAGGAAVADQPQVAAPDINNMALADESMPSLSDMAHEPTTGAWPDGWYPATILEGYATNSGHEFVTEDNPSKDGASRNLRICVAAKNKAGEARNYFTGLNYRKSDLTSQTMAAVKKALAVAKEQGWKAGGWPSEWKDLQRSVIAIQNLAQFERALGFKLSKTGEGVIKVAPFFGQQIDIRLRLNDESGYSEVAEFAKKSERQKLYK
jgi:hypothetical protein